MSRKASWLKKAALYALVLAMVIGLAGCGGGPGGESSSMESSRPAEPAESGTQTPETDGNGPVSYEAARELTNDRALEVSDDSVKQTNVVPEAVCEELKEVLSVYFTCFFDPELWGEYEFVEARVTGEWEETYQKIMKYADPKQTETLKIQLRQVFYCDEEDCYIQVNPSGLDLMQMHLTKTDGQWCVAEAVLGGIFGDQAYATYGSEEEQERAAKLDVEAVKKSREKNPVTEALLGDALARVIEFCTEQAGSGNSEEAEALRQEIEALNLEVLYEESWCDKVLAFACSKNMAQNLIETAFVVWVQPKEDVEPEQQELVWELFGADGGAYYLVYEIPQEGLEVAHAERMWQFEVPQFSLRSESWNAMWNDPAQSGSQTQEIDWSQPVSYEMARAFTKDRAMDVSYESVMMKNRTDYGRYDVISPQVCEELKEVLSVYFTCFFDSQLWGTYEFIEEEVTERWEELYENASRDAGLTEHGVKLLHVYYEDGNDFFLRVQYGIEKAASMYLTREDGQWNVEAVSQGNIYGEYDSEEDEDRAIAMYVEAVKRSREKNPVSEEDVREGILALTEHYVDLMWDVTPEESEILREQIEALNLEGFYDKEWSDKILALTCSQQFCNSMPCLEETAFVLWAETKQTYDPSSMDWMKERASYQGLVGILTSEYAQGEGGYYLVYRVPREGWSVRKLDGIPEYAERSAEWNEEWNVW